MNIDNKTVFTLGPSMMKVFNPDDESMTRGEEIEIKYSDYPDIHKLVSEFIKRVANTYSLTALGHICGRCGTCCTRENVMIRASDIFRIAFELGISSDQFRNRYMKETTTWNKYDGILKLENGQCPFLEKKPSGRYSCSIYHVRPADCRLFPPLYQTCKKDPCLLIYYLDHVKITGNEINIFSLDHEEDGRGAKKLFTFSGVLTDEKLKQLFQKIVDKISSVEGEPINRVEEAVKKAIDTIEKMIDNFPTESRKEEFPQELKDLAKIVEDLSRMSTISWGGESRIDDLWNVYRKLERLANREETAQEESQVKPSAPIFPRIREKTGVESISIYPQMLVIHVEREGEIFPNPVPINYTRELLESIRDLVKSLVTLEGEKHQQAVTEENPPCYLCGECCRVYSVEINPLDVLRIADNLGMTEKEFREEYLIQPRFSWNPGDGILIKERNSISGRRECKFLEKKEDGFFYCSIHEFKPEICGKYTSRNKLCRAINNPIYWYRLPSNIERIDLSSDRLDMHTSYTRGRSLGPQQIEWREYNSLIGPVNRLLKAVEEIVAGFPILAHNQQSHTPH